MRSLLSPARRSRIPPHAAAMLFVAAFTLPARGSAQAAPALARSLLVESAEQTLAAGRPFAASRLLAPALATPAGREPQVVLLAARAAAGWEGWGSVIQLLSGQPWLDGYAGGEGRALLARARVERGQSPLSDARQALLSANPETVGPRLVTLARAFDRANLLDSAAAAYLRAAPLLPAVADWLRLRAAGVLADSTARAALYRSVSFPAATPRIRWTEALARDRAGEWRAAARLYDALGAQLAGARLRLRAAETPAELAASRQELTGLLTPRLSAADLRDAVSMLDAAFPGLTAPEQLLVARRTVASDPERAARGFSRAAAAGPALSEADRLSYGSALARLGRHREAVAQLGSIRSPELRSRARYLRARSLLANGQRAEAIDALQQVALSPESDTTTAATAGFLLGDLQVDDGEESAARESYLAVARRFPGTSHGARAALQAALIAWAHQDRAVAAREFAALAERAAETTEGIAALYWSGRALFAAGDSARAAARWRSLLDRFPASYYTVPAAERLGVPAVREPPPALNAAADSAVSAALDRGVLLERLGLRVEARFEFDAVVRQAEAAPAGQLATARALAERGLTGRAFRMALRVAEPSAQRLAFPLPNAEALEEARDAGVDPLLTAALIRQESAFDPAARSAADARGLMQVLPSVGAGLAPAAGITEWDAALLYQPEINVHFGVVHLAQMQRSYPLLSAALAAYNAGDRPTRRWLALPGASDDPELFIERIQYLETRDYVRRIIRNLAVYRALYPSFP